MAALRPGGGPDDGDGDIPKTMTYAAIAGLPLVAGLYT
jgi:hypothetical protein